MTEYLTVDDFIRTGACEDGVHEWRDEHMPLMTAATAEELLAAGAGLECVSRASGRSGYGDGSGSGSGYGYGSGSGYGYGSGYGSGSGSGYGDGNG